jgi:hypothetical protein
MQGKLTIAAFTLLVGIAGASAQSITNIPVLKGLAPVTVLKKTAAGKAALELHRNGRHPNRRYSTADVAAFC